MITRRKFLMSTAYVLATAPSLFIPRIGYSNEERTGLESKFPEEFFYEYGTTKEEILDIVKMSKETRTLGGSRNFSPKKVLVLPNNEEPYVFEGIASFYTSDRFPGKTATGAPFHDYLPTVALNPRTKTAIPALVRLTNLVDGEIGTSTLAVANDKGPYVEDKRGRLIPHDKRVVDLSMETLNRLGLEKEKGLYKIRLEVLETYDINSKNS